MDGVSRIYIINMNANRKFLDEAIACAKRWEELNLLGKIPDSFMRDPAGVLLESVRLRNEFDGTDEEYQEYLKNFNNR